MLNCIHGVDKDERAVDICKLNLSLKLAKGGEKLPELHNNIKCGDSLIDNKDISDKAGLFLAIYESILPTKLILSIFIVSLYILLFYYIYLLQNYHINHY